MAPLLLALVASSVSCQRRAPRSVAESLLDVGYYKARLQEGDSGERKFRLLLFAAAPDRIHAEILSPLGNPQLIVDGGAGRMAVTFVRDGVSFVGDASPAVFGHLLGLELDLEQWVDALRGGLEHPTVSVLREGGGTLPDRLELRRAGQRLTLELRRRQPTPAGSEALGSAVPPPGTEVRPLTDLLDAPQRFEELESEAAGS